MKNLMPAIIGLFLGALPAVAADPGGTVTGTIDGQPVELSVFAQQSDYGNSHISLYIIGGDLGEHGLGALSLGAEWIGELDKDFVHVEISARLHDNPLRMYYSDNDDGLSLSLENATVTDDQLLITGKIEGVMTQMDRIGRKNPDPDQTRTIDLSFDAVVD
ncbi:hypothetical protein [Pseudosulfitobacter pseudonitzschiae]|uniref:hypothetical protein n=1 Tax=Pseudosulfitobacter pseudonitzschiae TaxID=1402135 RepID=UPI001AF97B9F|nr:hypothetical protein [Pseudosulfitobacter pseudonitzschiae]MBM1817439.1 hypothetical protein [Pseudosulfitobacter pseudonitzschiae]MBM1835115.1 hypothetical protein [Pseudosulfitobacter pseudonitzschiae]MBM1839988.1 hypothetical protein [Pseudosulfitobacter pseudonitzschiae]MBM1844850.1 hypothetical protein [Pseudosulfitobacter pseudonitzschiae]MBM1849650.1 hypothetical protein [Pseudosulfitobacter pseudonitzschiae]